MYSLVHWTTVVTKSKESRLVKNIISNKNKRGRIAVLKDA